MPQRTVFTNAGFAAYRSVRLTSSRSQRTSQRRRKRSAGRRKNRPQTATAWSWRSIVVAAVAIGGMILVGITVMLPVVMGDGLKPYWATRAGTWAFPFVGAIGLAPILMVAVVVAAVLIVQGAKRRLSVKRDSSNDSLGQ